MAAIEKTGGAELQELDKEHHLHPFTDHKELHKTAIAVEPGLHGCTWNCVCFALVVFAGL